MELRNIGDRPVDGVYVGAFHNPLIGYWATDENGSATFGVGGFRDSILGYRCSEMKIDASLAWFASLTGSPINGQYTDQIAQDLHGNWIRPTPYVCAFVVLSYPRGALEHPAYLSYNWWRHYGGCEGSPDISPEHKDSKRHVDPGCTGNPQTPGDTYFLLSNGEIDYDPLYSSSIQQTDPIWRYPSQEVARNVSAQGDFLKYVISIGPYDLQPGQSIHIPFALVYGEHFHNRPNNADFLPEYPDRYYANLDFSDLDKNINWAKWIYDNPGVDTDSDGYAGDLDICNQDSTLTDSGWVATVADTFYATGDGVPVWRPVSPRLTCGWSR